MIVDGSGEFHSNHEDVVATIYDSERPYGPYTCTKCEAEYDKLTESPSEVLRYPRERSQLIANCTRASLTQTLE